MSSQNDDTIILKVTGDFAKQIKDMQKKLGVKSEMDVVRQGLTLLYYSIGSKITITRADSKESLVFDQFKNKK